MFKHILVSMLMAVSVATIAKANTLNFTVPFENVRLTRGQSLSANYTIGQHKIIFCFENNLQNVGIITWPYKGTTQQGSLPIFLKTDAQFQGSFADNSGVLSIQNNQTFALIVSCMFGF